MGKQIEGIPSDDTEALDPSEGIHIHFAAFVTRSRFIVILFNADEIGGLENLSPRCRCHVGVEGGFLLGSLMSLPRVAVAWTCLPRVAPKVWLAVCAPGI